MKHFYVLCDAVEAGFLDSDVTATIRGYKAGQEEYVRGAADSIREENGRKYLYIGVVRQDLTTKAWLVQLPTEADSGTQRMWVPEASVIQVQRSPTAVTP